jgi:pimeloyl-ACP methyl ester carboxylesterase
MKYLYLFLIGFLLIFFFIDKIRQGELEKVYKNKCNSKGKIENIDGTIIYYIEEGEGEPLLIIHGFMASCLEFTEISSILSKKLKVISIDLIGFGKSDKSPGLDYSKTNMARLISLLMRRKGFSSYNVLGHSMGGEVALNLLTSYKSEIKSLILVSSVGWVDVYRTPLPAFILKHIFLMYSVQKFFYRLCFYNKKYYEKYKFERIYYLNSQIPGKTLNSFMRKNDNNKKPNLTKDIACPVLILWGRHDRIVSLGNAYKFHKSIENSTLKIFEHSGHLPYIEEQVRFVCEIIKFLTT